MTFLDLAVKLRARGGWADKLLRRERDSGNDYPPEWKKILALLLRTVENGLEVVARNDSKCKLFGGEYSGLGEFKCHPWRLMFFRDPFDSSRIIITHCFKKKRQKTPPAELRRSLRLKARYEQLARRPLEL